MSARNQPKPLLQELGAIAAWTLFYVVLTDLVGAAVCFYLDTFTDDSMGAALFYTIWFVLGVFCGMFIYVSAGSSFPPRSKYERSTREEISGLLVILTAPVVLLALSIPLYLFQWRYIMSSGFVEDSAPLTLTFFVTIAVSMGFFHYALRPDPS